MVYDTVKILFLDLGKAFDCIYVFRLEPGWLFADPRVRIRAHPDSGPAIPESRPCC